MHHVNYFWFNLGTGYMGQCISVTDIAHLLGQNRRECTIKKEKLCA